MWEVLAFFESINKTSLGEPDRYHECRVKAILETLEKDEIWHQYEEVELEKRRVIDAKRKKKNDANPRKSLENIADKIEGNDDDEFEEEVKENRRPGKKNRPDLEDSGIFDRQDINEDDDFAQNMDDEEDEIIEILRNDKNAKPNKKQDIKTPTKHQTKPGVKTPARPQIKPNVEETKQPSRNRNNDADLEESAEFIVGKKIIDSEPNNVDNVESNKSPKIKHIFEINVKEIRNIPILKKILKDLNRGDKQSEAKQENKYIQDVYVKYIFPLDDEQIVSDFLEYAPREDNSVDFKVSMHSYHSYLLETDKSIADSLK